MNAPLTLHCCANTKKYYLCSVIFRKSNNIRVRIRSFLKSRIIFVFVFGHQNTIRSPLIGSVGSSVSGWIVFWCPQTAPNAFCILLIPIFTRLLITVNRMIKHAAVQDPPHIYCPNDGGHPLSDILTRTPTMDGTPSTKHNAIFVS